jgi:hypothetical protein
MLGAVWAKETTSNRHGWSVMQKSSARLHAVQVAPHRKTGQRPPASPAVAAPMRYFRPEVASSGRQESVPHASRAPKEHRCKVKRSAQDCR